MSDRRRRNLLRDKAGISMVEFGFVGPVLILMMMGLFDLAHRSYVGVVLQGAIERAGRHSTLQSGTINAAALNAGVENEVRELVGVDAVFTPSRLSYQNFSDIGLPEDFRDTNPANGRYDAGECFVDANGNGQWDAERGRTGQGGAHDVVVYQISVSYPRMFPMAGLLGWPENQTVSATTVLRNQPWAMQTLPTVCP